MARYEVVLTKQAIKDANKIVAAGLGPKARKLLELIEKDPFATYPPYEKLLGDLTGFYSRRINIQHRLVYQILPDDKIVKVLRMGSHYE
jgi:toxin YoeB